MLTPKEVCDQVDAERYRDTPPEFQRPGGVMAGLSPQECATKIDDALAELKLMRERFHKKLGYGRYKQAQDRYVKQIAAIDVILEMFKFVEAL